MELQERIDLQDGKAGIALSCAYRGDAELALQLLDDAEEALAERPLPLDLFVGVTGVAWAGDQIRAVLGEQDLERNEAVDDLLLAHLDRPSWPFHHDLASGLVGFGLYALCRASLASGRAIAERAVDHLRRF